MQRRRRLRRAGYAAGRECFGVSAAGWERFSDSAPGAQSERQDRKFLHDVGDDGAASDHGQSAQQPDIDCPLIDIREGASTLTIPPPPPDGSNEAMSLQYQGIFVRAARDCKAAGNQLVMRVGVEGRVIVGPAGGPGEVDVPLRIAIVDSPAGNPQTVLTKLIRIPVTLGPSRRQYDVHPCRGRISLPDADVGGNR